MKSKFVAGCVAGILWLGLPAGHAKAAEVEVLKGVPPGLKVTLSHAEVEQLLSAAGVAALKIPEPYRSLLQHVLDKKKIREKDKGNGVVVLKRIGKPVEVLSR